MREPLPDGYASACLTSLSLASFGAYLHIVFVSRSCQGDCPLGCLSVYGCLVCGHEGRGHPNLAFWPLLIVRVQGPSVHLDWVMKSATKCHFVYK